MSRQLLTGATGFTGPALVASLRAVASGGLVFAGRGESRIDLAPGERWHTVADLDAHTDWKEALEGVDVVVHAAARAHVAAGGPVNGLAGFLRVNTEGTKRLARCAAAAGVRRFVFLSSVKVNGESTRDAPFTERDTPQPQGPYAVSKWEAECALREIAAESGMAFVIVRAPLVYGPGVKANLCSLASAVQRGLPLPLGAVENRRSLLGLSNLAHALALCAVHPAAVNETFLVSDGEDLSTPGLIRRIASAMDTTARLPAVPVPWLAACARLAGRTGVFERLCCDLRVDSGKIREILGWAPPCGIDEELARMAGAMHNQ